MKKLIITLAVLGFSLITQAQSIKLIVRQDTVKRGYNMLSINPISIIKDSVIFYYELLDTTDGYVVEKGNKKVPIQALEVIAQHPIDTGLANPLLNTWGIQAIRQKD